MKVKICGLTTLADARFCAGAGADLLGFIQYPDSPRYVAPGVVKEILAWVYGAEAVGVFVNADADEVDRTAEAVGFDLVQLHGDEPPGVCAAVAPPVIKALRVRPGETADELRRRMDPYLPHVRYLLLDTHRAGTWGGTGETFDWEIVGALTADYPLFLAGGLSPDNVAEAVRLSPTGLDVSSRLEAAPGEKDLDKVTAFFDAYRNALQQAAPSP